MHCPCSQFFHLHSRLMLRLPSLIKIKMQRAVKSRLSRPARMVHPRCHYLLVSSWSATKKCTCRFLQRRVGHPRSSLGISNIINYSTKSLKMHRGIKRVNPPQNLDIFPPLQRQMPSQVKWASRVAFRRARRRALWITMSWWWGWRMSIIGKITRRTSMSEPTCSPYTSIRPSAWGQWVNKTRHKADIWMCNNQRTLIRQFISLHSRWAHLLWETLPRWI